MKKLTLSVIIIMFCFGIACADSSYDKCYNTCKVVSEKCYKRCKSDRWCTSKCNQNLNECSSRCVVRKK
jgi:hypothetical protein